MPDDIFAEARRDGRLKETGVNMAAIARAQTVRTALPGLEPAEPGSSFECVLPYGPSINHYWRHRIVTPKNGGEQFIAVYTSAEGVAFQKAVADLVGKVKALTGPLVCHLLVNPPNALEIDVDNRIKPCADALAEAGVMFNDKQIQEWHVSLGAIYRPDGMMVVRIVPRVA